MTIKKLIAVVFGVRPRGVTRVPITPELGVRVTLREATSSFIATRAVKWW